MLATLSFIFAMEDMKVETHVKKHPLEEEYSEKNKKVKMDHVDCWKQYITGEGPYVADLNDGTICQKASLEDAKHIKENYLQHPETKAFILNRVVETFPLPSGQIASRLRLILQSPISELENFNEEYEKIMRQIIENERLKERPQNQQPPK